MSSLIRSNMRTVMWHIFGDKYLKRNQNKRLHKLVEYAKKNSPAYAELYKDLPKNFKLEDLPMVTKPVLMENFNNFVTDRDVTIEGVNEFLKLSNNLTEQYLGKYLINKTSGSTGHPLTMLHDKEFYTDLALVSNATFGGIKNVPAVMILAADIRGIVQVSTLNTVNDFKFFLNNKYFLIDQMQAMPKLVDKLNEIKPKQIYIQPSTLAVLATKQVEGALKINPKIILTGGEDLSDKIRDFAEKTFKCKVRSIYGCTELGGIAMECDNKRHHIVNNNIIFELVDENNNPVKPGEYSARVLYTNLSDHCLPLIRYEVTDNVRLIEGKCPCGNKSPCIELLGREPAKTVVLSNGKNKIELPPFNFWLLWECESNVMRAQFIVHGFDTIEVRIDFMPGIDPKTEFAKIEGKLRNFLDNNGLENVKYYLSDEQTIIDPVSHKYKYLYQLDN